ncbi:cell wall-binding repeat-containing protein [Schumannella luteola]
MSLRTLLAGAVSVVAVAALSVVGAPSASAASYTVSGTMLMENEAGQFVTPTQGYTIRAYSVTGNGFYDVSSTYGGAWSVALPEGRYRFLFSASGYFNPNEIVPFAESWYGNTPFEYDSPVIDVSGPVSGIAGQIPRGATISGDTDIPNTGLVTAYIWDETANRYLPKGFTVNTGDQGEYTLSGLPEGQYIVRYTILDLEYLGGYYWGDSRYPEGAAVIDVAHRAALTGYDVTIPQDGLYVDRLAGPDRFATSVAISQAAFENAPGAPEVSAVFVVNGLNFPDALSAGPAAARLGAPVLLVTPTSIPASVRAEIERLDPDTIYIVGGTPSVSTAVESQLGVLADVVRVSGSDRFATSREVATTFFADADVYSAYLATGLNFPDALGAGPAAAFEGGPLLLVNGGLGSVDAATADVVASLDINRLVVTGSAATVSDGILASLNSLPSIDEVVRQGGADRFGTAFEINNGDNIDGGAFHFAETVFLTTGYGFPDALAASSAAASIGAPIYLVQPHCVPGVVINEIIRLRADQVILLGSSATLSTAVENLTVC